MGQITDLHVMILIVQGGSIPDLYDLARVTAWGLHNLHDITRVSWAGFVLCISCTTHIIRQIEDVKIQIVICPTYETMYLGRGLRFALVRNVIKPAVILFIEIQNDTKQRVGWVSFGFCLTDARGQKRTKPCSIPRTQAFIHKRCAVCLTFVCYGFQ